MYKGWLLILLSMTALHAMEPSELAEGGPVPTPRSLRSLCGLGVAVAYAVDWLCESWRHDRPFVKAMFRVTDRIESYCTKLDIAENNGVESESLSCVAYLADRRHNHLRPVDFVKACNKLTVAIDRLESVRQRRSVVDHTAVEKVVERFKYYRDECIAYKKCLYAGDNELLDALSDARPQLEQALETPQLVGVVAELFADLETPHLDGFVAKSFVKDKGDIRGALLGLDQVIGKLATISQRYEFGADFTRALDLRQLLVACRHKLLSAYRVSCGWKR